MRCLVVLAIQYSSEPLIRRLLLIHAPAHYTISKMLLLNVSSAFIVATPAMSIQYALPATRRPIIESSMQQQSCATVNLDTTTTLWIELAYLACPNASHAQMLQNAHRVALHS